MTRPARLFINARISRFAMIGAFGAVCNITIMTALITLSADYLVAAIIAAEITIVSNFILQEKLAFADLPGPRRPLFHRFLYSITFNTLEAGARLPFLWLLVEIAHVGSVLAQAGTIVAAFFIRYGYHLKFVYATRQPRPESAAARALTSTAHPIATRSSGRRRLMTPH